MITKDDKGKVHVNKDEDGGRATPAGAAQPLVLSSASSSHRPIIGSALVGGAIGGISGHLWRGISRSDVKELGELIDEGEAALLVVGATTLQEAIDKAGLRPTKQVIKQVDTSTADVDAAVADAASEVS